MFKKVLSAPLKQMAINAGMDWYEVVNNVTNSFDIGQGYNFKDKLTCDMYNAGIIDPYKVVRLALESATAIASSLVSVETVITTEEEQPKKANE
jgi:chaperonin GroEL